MNQKIVIGITQGDTNGVGYEVIIKSLADPRILDLCTPVVYGSSKAFGFYKKLVPDNEAIETNIINTAKDARQRKINIINCVPDTFKIDPGQQSQESARASIISLEACVADLKKGDLDAIVTAPFNKKAVAADSFKFTGHTEYFIHEFGVVDGLMFLCSDSMKVGVATNHTPLAQVSSVLSIEKIVGKLKLMDASLRQDFNIVRPRIAVLGLNPHAGDEGLLGDEEIKIISPAIKAANDAGILAFGPYPSDGFFCTGQQNNFDAVLAMYHDQGLIPFKSLSFDSGVNFTAGLPVVRTSPDHGTAYELAGKGVANAMPMRSSIYAAIDIVRNREVYEEMHRNPLKSKIEEMNGGSRGPV